MGDWVMIGVPSSAGAHHAGQERAPGALRAAGLAERLGAAGELVLDRGNLPGAKFVTDRDHPGGRNLPAVVRGGARGGRCGRRCAYWPAVAGRWR